MESLYPLSIPAVNCMSLCIGLNTNLFTAFSKVAGCSLHCAHWETTVLSWGPSEHRDHTSYLALPFGGRALREHRRSSGSIPSSLPRVFPIPLHRVGWSILYCAR